MLLDREILGRDGKTPSREGCSFFFVCVCVCVCVYVCVGRDSCRRSCRGNIGIKGDVSGLVYFRN